MGKKSGGKAPVAPDPMVTAQAQKQMNVDTAVAQANLNRIDQVGPTGSVTYTQSGTNADGTPKYTQTTSLNPQLQAITDALNGAAASNIGGAVDSLSKPLSYDGLIGIQEATGPHYKTHLDYGGLTKLPGTDDFGAEQARMSEAVYRKAASRLDPRFEQQESDMRSRLAAQGISENSDAYRRELDNFGRTKNDAYEQAVYSSIGAGSDEQSRLFGLALAARNQGKSEADAQGAFYNQAEKGRFEGHLQAIAMNNASRAQQIGELHSLRGNQMDEIARMLDMAPGNNVDFSPVSQVGVSSPDYMGAVQNKYTNDMNRYNQQQAARSQALGSVFGLAGTAMQFLPWSDRRLKENIRRIGSLANGIATYAFNYIGDRAQQFGVMAQEVLDVIPEAVVQDPSGYMRVNYGKVF